MEIGGKSYSGYYCAMNFRATIGCFTVLLAVLFAAAPGIAVAGSIIDSSKALAGVRAGEITLIDVRSAKEWRETGVPKGAKPASRLHP